MIAVGLTMLSWAALPATLVTHWGTGGADAVMPREWAVAIPLVMCVGPAGWTLLRAFTSRQTLAACMTPRSCAACSPGSASRR
ncbi:DUF1648 domain-containing protein [Mobilicoccus pelagius]|uniref:DUF1648 domain-containing protein n=1 Tax=Mobilicoccus pelagius TaxID=746032 RepID=UPI0035710FB1